MAIILIMEDNSSLRRIVAQVLEEDGHIVVQSEDGFAAYNDDLLLSVDLMITDLVMPRVDGLEAIRTALKTRGNLKIIAMSGGSRAFEQDYLEVAKVFGAKSIIHKPFEPDALVKIVNTALAA